MILKQLSILHLMLRFKSAISILALIVCATMHAQETRLSVQTGHSSTINDITYNQDNTLIASASSDNKIGLWHVESGKQYGSLVGHSRTVTGVAFDPAKSILYSVSMDSCLAIWNIEKCQLVEKIKYEFPLGAVDISPDGKSLAIAGKGIIIRKLEDNIDKKYSLETVDLLTTIKYAHKGQWIAAGGKNETVGHILDTKDMSVISKFIAPATDIVFEKHGTEIYYSTENGSIVKFDFYQNKISGSTTESEWNSFTAVRITDKYIIGATDQAEIMVYNKSNWNLETILKAHLRGLRCLDVSNDGSELISSGLDRKIIQWDLHRKEMIRTYQSKIYRINDIGFTEDGNELIIGFANGFVRKTNLLTNTSVSNRAKLNQDQIENGYEFFLTHKAFHTNERANFRMIMLRNSADDEGLYNYLKDIDLRWNYETNKLIVKEVDTKSRMVREYIDRVKRNERPNIQSLMRADNLQSKSTNYTASAMGKKVTIKESASGKTLTTIETDHTDLLTSVAINERYGFVATASWDGMIKFWGLKDGKLLSTLGAFGGHDFIYLNSENYYFSSKGALSHIAFIRDGHLFSFDQFDLKYNRPDLVFQQLPYVEEQTVANYHKAYQKRLSKLGLQESDLHISEDIPEIQIHGLSSTISYNGYYSFNIKARDEKNNLEAYHVHINGVPIYSRKGMKISGSEFSYRDSVRLNPGRNHVRVFVTNEEGVSSFKKDVAVTSKEKDLESELYLLTVGCSKYQQSDYNLNYAEKDASDISKFFSKSKMFDAVHVKSLVNENVVLSEVNKMKDFINEADENDVVLVFVAGHGVLDANLDYFIASHDMDFSQPQEKGIPFSFFEDLLDQTKSRKKLMFIDACHSGEIDKSEVAVTETEAEAEGDVTFRSVGSAVKNVNEVNSFELSKIAFADVRESNGSSVLSSAGGGEYALEGDKWSNGVFTYALLSGLETGDADLNNDKKILVSEMYTYLIQKVNKMTGGKQTPTSRVENLANDFIIH